MFALDIAEKKFSHAVCYLLVQSTLHQGRGKTLVEMIILAMIRDESVALDMHVIMPFLSIDNRPVSFCYLALLPHSAIIL
jgi:hypothetical protein